MIPARLPTQIPLPAAGDAKTKRLAHLSDPQALLREAIEGGDRDAVLRLLEEGGAALANKPLPGSGLTPLAFAATIGSAVVDGFLGRQDVDHDRPSGPQGATPLFIAAARGDAFLAAFLLARTDVDPGATASNGDSPLHAACRFGHEDVVELLLAHPDTRPNENNRAGKTALHEAAIAGVAAMTVMLRCGRVCADARTRNGSTVILLAASRGDVPMVQLLLKDPSHAHLVDEPAVSGATPLHVAAAKGHEGVVALLLEHGQNVLARVNQTDRFGQTPLSLARQNGHRQVAALLKRITRVESPARGVTVSSSKGSCVFVLGPHHQKFPRAGIKALARSHRVRLTECGDGINPESWKKFWKRSVPAGAPLLLLCHGSWSRTESQHKLDLTSGPMVPTVQVVLRYHERGVRRFFLLSCEIGKAAQALATFINEDPAWPKAIDPSLAITLVGSEDETLSSSYDWELTNAIKEIAGDEPGALCAQTVQDIWHIRFDPQVGRMTVIHVPTTPDAASAMDRLPGQPTRAGILSLKHAMDGGQRSLDMIRALAQRGHLDLGFRDCFDCSLLHVAAVGGCTDIMELLLDLPGATKEITRLNAFGKSPFHLAVEKGHVDIARRLLDRGASLHLRTSSGMSCLMLAALGPQPEMTRLLLVAGATANETGPRGRTPLHMAVSVGQHCTVQLLLEAGADITTADDDGLQALAIAAERGDGRCVSVLLAQPGVDVHARTHGGATAEDIARENSHEHIADRLRDAARMRDQSTCSVM